VVVATKLHGVDGHNFPA